MELLRFFATAIGFALVLVDLFFLSKLLRSAKAQQWENAEQSCNVISALFLCISLFVFLGTFSGLQDGSLAARLGLSLLKMIGTMWPFAIANVFIVSTFRKKIRDGKESQVGTEENATHMGTVPPSAHQDEQDREN